MAESIVYACMMISIFVSQQQIEVVVGEWKGRGHRDAYSCDCCQCVYINIATTRKVRLLCKHEYRKFLVFYFTCCKARKISGNKCRPHLSTYITCREGERGGASL